MGGHCRRPNESILRNICMSAKFLNRVLGFADVKGDQRYSPTAQQPDSPTFW